MAQIAPDGDIYQAGTLSGNPVAVAAGAMVLVGLSWGSFFVALFFGYMAYSSYRTLKAYQASLW